MKTKLTAAVSAVVHTSYLPDVLREAHLRRAGQVSAASDEEVNRIGPAARICMCGPSQAGS